VRICIIQRRIVAAALFEFLPTGGDFEPTYHACCGRHISIVLRSFFPASAQSLKEKVTGTWIFESGSDNFSDGKKLSSWVAGSLMLDSTGHVALFLIGSDRQKANPNIRTPVGPVVAFFGTYTIDEAKNMLTFKISYGSSPLFDGAVRTQEISFRGDIMVLTASAVQTPAGPMTPVNEWKKAN
jgi:hypothetical protein